MQDRYAGDLGDFLKFGLLRWLCFTGDYEPPLRLGVVWYLTRDELHNADGKHVAYLDPSHRTASELRSLDPDLYERLATVVASGHRSTSELERAGVLPSGSSAYGRVLDFSDLPVTSREARAERRQTWLKDALAITQDCDLIFVDPDNGVRRTDHAHPSHRTKSVKHAYLDELNAFTLRGQSIIAYHHADRSAPVHKQAMNRLADLGEAVSAKPVAAVRASRGTTRLFLVAANQHQLGSLSSRLKALEASRWRSELTVYWWPKLIRF